MTSKKAKRELSDKLAQETLDWVVTRHPEYTAFATSEGKTVAHRLEATLRAMCWRLTDWVRIDKKPREEYDKMIREVTKAWTPDLDTEVKAYLLSGGYRAAEEFAESLEAEEKDSTKGSLTLNSIEEELAEEIENLEPRAQLSPEHELEEILIEAERSLNPNYKTW